MTVTIIKGDCRDVLRTMESESVHCVVTSPPYWGLRDYGVGGQLGMERTLGEHVETMADVFREVRRVLRGDGTLWLNYGDSYATSVNGRSAADTKAAGNDDRTFRDKPFSTIGPIYDPTPSGAGGSYEDERPGWAADRGRIRAGGMLKPKDLCGIPWRVAFALQADGWYLRQDIIWSKPNPMPESVRDRCTKAHEYIFLLSKSERYYYDQGAIKQQAAPASFARLGQDIENQNGSNRVPGKTNGPMKAVYGGKNKHDGYGTRIQLPRGGRQPPLGLGGANASVFGCPLRHLPTRADRTLHQSGHKFGRVLFAMWRAVEAHNSKGAVERRPDEQPAMVGRISRRFLTELRLPGSRRCGAR
jgi:DNA modification methylase